MLGSHLARMEGVKGCKWMEFRLWWLIRLISIDHFHRSGVGVSFYFVMV
jgi:hypothetical protein